MADSNPAFDYALRDTFLNAILAEGFMTGLYTLLFGYTIYLISSQRKSLRAHFPILILTSTLYILVITHFGIQWLSMRRMYIVNGDTEQSELNYLEFGQKKEVYVTSSVLNAASTLLADGILVWRCWVVWDRSLKHTAIPMLAWIGELVTAIIAQVNLAKPLGTNVTGDPSTPYFALSLATTIICSGMILYRVIQTYYSSSNSETAPAYLRVAWTIAESAAIYSLVLIIFLPMYVSKDFRVNFESEYVKRIVLGVTGIAPTLIIVRVIEAAQAMNRRPGESNPGIKLKSMPTITQSKMVIVNPALPADLDIETQTQTTNGGHEGSSIHTINEAANEV